MVCVLLGSSLTGELNGELRPVERCLWSVRPTTGALERAPPVEAVMSTDVIVLIERDHKQIKKLFREFEAAAQCVHTRNQQAGAKIKPPLRPQKP